MNDQIAALADAVADAERVVAFTGAGVSTASGIPDFRSEGGIWEDHDPGVFNIAPFERDPAGFWEQTLGLYDDAFPPDPEPNAAHEALATLESAGHLEAVVTQNADRLHQDAGSEEVIELHGNMRRTVCQSCKAREPLADARARAVNASPPLECLDCGGMLKPDTVLFGEQLPEYALFRSHSLSEKADVFLVAGSSLLVEPAASLPETAADNGATLAIVNFDETPHDDIAEYTLRRDVTEVLPALAEAAVERPG